MIPPAISSSIAMMTRRLFRSGLQLGLFTALVFTLLYLVDSRYRVLPSTIHNALPAHHPGLVVVDVTVATCSFGSCAVPAGWRRIDKDLYLGDYWLNKAYVHVQQKREEELTAADRVVVDVRTGRLEPRASQGKSDAWERRPGGIWLLRSASGRRASDSDKAVTSIDVLFGSDAVEPRPGWEIRDAPISLGHTKDGLEARLTVRRGPAKTWDKPTVRVGQDGRFKIMQVSDMHLSTGVGACRDPEPPQWNGGKCEADPRTLDFIERLLDEEKPDMVALSGDQVNGETAPDAQTALFKAVKLFATRRIPYAAIMGNHDDEGSLTRTQMVELLASLPYSLTSMGPRTLPGSGNYYVQVMSHNGLHSALTLWFLDSHSYSPDERKYKGYDWIKPEQISWFKDVAGGLKGDNKKYSHIHLDMAFIHIPIPEYRGAGLMIGNRNETVTAPQYNSGFYDALIDMDIPVVSCGHDHVNDFCLFPDKQKIFLADKGKDGKPPGTSPNPATQPKFDKIWLCYAGGSGFGGYGGYGGYHRRVRFWELNANEGRITTWKRVEHGETEKRLDEQMVVNAGKVVVPKLADDEGKATVG